jgi:hypothetical protein
VRNIRQWNLIAGIVLALHPIGRLRRGFLSLAKAQLAASSSAARSSRPTHASTIARASMVDSPGPEDIRDGRAIMAPKPVDVAVITVIQAELDALRRALHWMTPRARSTKGASTGRGPSDQSCEGVNSRTR